jgi:hypothetical protein
MEIVGMARVTGRRVLAAMLVEDRQGTASGLERVFGTDSWKLCRHLLARTALDTSGTWRRCKIVTRNVWWILDIAISRSTGQCLRWTSPSVTKTCGPAIGVGMVDNTTDQSPHSLAFLALSNGRVTSLVLVANCFKLWEDNLVHLGSSTTAPAQLDEVWPLNVQISEGLLPATWEAICSQPRMDSISWPLSTCILGRSTSSGGTARLLALDGWFMLERLATTGGGVRLGV